MLGKRPIAAAASASELDAVIALIVWAPERCPEMPNGRRRSVMRRFPFILVFRVFSKIVREPAVQHGRRPGYWKDREQGDRRGRLPRRVGGHGVAGAVECDRGRRRVHVRGIVAQRTDDTSFATCEQERRTERSRKPAAPHRDDESRMTAQ